MLRTTAVEPLVKNQVPVGEDSIVDEVGGGDSQVFFIFFYFFLFMFNVYVQPCGL